MLAKLTVLKGTGFITMESKKFLFQVRTTIDSKCWWEIYWSTISARDKLIQAVLGVCFFMALAILVKSCAQQNQIVINTGISVMIILGTAVFTLVVFCLGFPWRVVKRIIGDYKKSFNKDCIHCKFFFTEDNITSSCVEKQNYSEYSYHQIEWMKETKHYIVLKDKGRDAFFILDKAGFIVGDTEQFRQFICKRI